MVLSLMGDVSIDILRTVSILGYCLLPMVMLAIVAIVLPMTELIGIILTVLCVAWCTQSSALMFTTALDMKERTLLVAYPLALFYACFALLTIF
mmetsp:Transcript_2052/g.2276  ORF Transcript_2052/g.2276 Transcript_2052/m.2276 type:complete len:94 (+) Transcript_2052:83-364(+)